MKKFTFIIAALIISSAVFAQTMLQTAETGKTRLNEQVVLKGTKAPVATLTYSSETMAVNLGYAEPWDFVVVAQFPASTMATYTGNNINKISIGVAPANLTGNISVCVWTDTTGGGATPVTSQTVAVSSLVAGWNEITLSTPYAIDGSQIWVGYTVSSLDYGLYMDNQAAQADGYGDLIYDGETWANTSAYGASFDHNWHIKAIVDDGADFTDLSVIALTAPNSTCELGTEDFVATVKNVGSSSFASAFNVNFAVNQDYANAVSFPVTVPLAVDATQDITFSLDMSVDGIYIVEAYVSVVGDSDLTNDTAMNAAANTEPSTVPVGGFINNFDGQYDLIGVSTFDENSDGSTWGFFYDVAPDVAAVYQYSSANAANDWLVLNCMDLTAGTYILTFDYKSGDGTDAYTESLKVMYGMTADPSGLTTQIVDIPTAENLAYVNSSTSFNVAADGTYYIGFQAYSIADQYLLWVNNITLNKDVTGVNSNLTNAVSVFPNPASSVVTVANAENANIVIMNMVGEVVANVENASANQTIDMSNLANGTYFVRVNAEVFKINLVK